MLERLKNFDIIQGLQSATTGRETLLVHGRSYNVLRQVGEGANSIVYLCQAGVGKGAGGENLPSEVAVKRVIVPRSLVAKVHEEMDLLVSLQRHRNIIRCFGSEIAGVQGQHCVSMVLEYCPRTLIQRMMEMSSGNKFFDEDTVLVIFCSIAAAVSYLHSQSPPIAHRDIKPENLLVAANGDFKLCDFGSASRTAFVCQGQKDAARIREEIEEMTTIAYRAPEMVDPWRRDRIDEKTDVWALGVFLYYLMYFKFPFAETSLAILAGRYEFPATPRYSDELKRVVSMCLCQRPSERWPVFDLCACLRENAARRVSQHAQLSAVVANFVFPLDGNAQNEQGLASSLDTPTAPTTTTNFSGAPCNAAAQAAEGGDLFSLLDWSANANAGTAAPARRSQVPQPRLTKAEQQTTQQQTPPPPVQEAQQEAKPASLDDALFGPPSPGNKATQQQQQQQQCVLLPQPRQSPSTDFDPFGFTTDQTQQQPQQQLQQQQQQQQQQSAAPLDLFSAMDWGTNNNSNASATSGQQQQPQGRSEGRANLDDIFAGFAKTS